MPEEGGAVFPLILSNPPPVYDASFGFLLYWKRPSERYFQTAFCLFLRKFCTAAAGEKTVFPLCQTAVFSVACLKLRPNGLVWMPKFCVSRCLKWFGSLERHFPCRIGLSMRSTVVSDGRIRMPCRPQGFHFAILLLWRITIGYGDNCHNMRRLLL